jgi:hypothetical protein
MCTIQIALIVKLTISNSQRFTIFQDALYSANFFADVEKDLAKLVLDRRTI